MSQFDKSPINARLGEPHFPLCGCSQCAFEHARWTAEIKRAMHWADSIKSEKTLYNPVNGFFYKVIDKEKPVMEPEPFDIYQWTYDIIEDPTGFNAFEAREWPIYDVPDRVAVARWVVRCLANPNCEGSEEVLKMIVDRRKDKGGGWSDG